MNSPIELYISLKKNLEEASKKLDSAEKAGNDLILGRAERHYNFADGRLCGFVALYACQTGFRCMVETTKHLDKLAKRYK